MGPLTRPSGCMKLMVSVGLALSLSWVGVATAAPTTAPQMYISHAGHSINGADVPASVVRLTATSSRPLTSVTFSIAGRVVGSSAVVSTSSNGYAVVTDVDLRGLSGPAVLRTRFVGTTSSWSVDKRFRAVVPLTPIATPVAPAAPAPAPQPTPEPAATAPLTPAPTDNPTAPVSPTSPDTATGVPAGTPLTPMTGNLIIRTPGAVVDGVDLAGCVTVKADDVVIRNSRITCAMPTNPTIVYSKGYKRLTIEDTEIDGAGTAPIAVGFSDVTIRRVEIRNVADGVRASTNVVIEESWIHDLSRVGSLHSDAIQSTGGTNIVIRGNTLDPTTAGNGDPHNAAIMLGSETSAQLANVLVENNRLGGGNFTVNVRGDVVSSNIVFRGNVFSGNARYGPAQAPARIDIDASNTAAATGLPITVKLV